MGIARQWAGQHDDQCEDTEFHNSIACLCLDRFIAAHTATPRNLHVLIVTEEGKQVHTGAYATHHDMLQAWKDWVVSVATEETALDEELRDLAAMDDVPDIKDAVDDLSVIDLTHWWEGRDDLNEVRFYEVQDRRK